MLKLADRALETLPDPAPPGEEAALRVVSQFDSEQG